MKRGIITITESGVVSMPTAPVWMTQFEIADLFGVFSCDVRKAVHSIYKNKELDEANTMKYVRPTVKLEVQQLHHPPSSLERSGKGEGGRWKSRRVAGNTKNKKGDLCLPQTD